jgi:pimeloyl-ACP methyl ester carboxylesterase
MTTFVLVPGMWLGAWAWREVTTRLRAAGHDVFPLTLTGVADRAHVGGPDTDLDTHAADVVALIETEELTGVVLVGHSYAGSVVTLAADRIPERLAAVVYVDAGPLPNGTSLLDTHDDEARAGILAGLGDGARVAPRQWDPGADPTLLAGLSTDALAQLRRRSTGHPFASINQPLVVSDAAAKVPRALITCSFPLDQVHAMIEQGHPYFAGLATAEILSLPTGHWPMLSEPRRLADLLAGIG